MSTLPPSPVRTPNPPTDSDGGGDARRKLLDTSSAARGTEWSIQLRLGLRRAGRAAAGGFPGTMSEARVHASRAIEPLLAEASMHGLEHDERERTARIAYAAARRDWLRHGEADED